MIRKARAVWRGTGKDGKGELTTDSGVLSSTPYSFKTRFESEKGTNPEELIAAAHAGCFTMALAFQLQGAGVTPTELSTEAAVSLDIGFGRQPYAASGGAAVMQMPLATGRCSCSEVLSDADDTKADVIAAFRRAAKKAHPDAGGAAKMFRVLVEARDRLLAAIGTSAPPPKPPTYAPAGARVVYQGGAPYARTGVLKSTSRRSPATARIARLTRRRSERTGLASLPSVLRPCGCCCSCAARCSGLSHARWRHDAALIDEEDQG